MLSHSPCFTATLPLDRSELCSGCCERASGYGGHIVDRCGWITLGLAGQMTITTAGFSLDSISSTLIVSVAVIWPVASSVILDMRSRCIRDLQPRQFSSTDMC
jgi:hypothetical protein